jgi:hypothetical protein
MLSPQIVELEGSDIEGYVELLNPWDASLRQISAGRFNWRMEAVQTSDIVIYRERWSRGVLATSSIPPGFFAFCSAMTHVAPPARTTSRPPARVNSSQAWR